MLTLAELKKQVAEIKDLDDFFRICNAEASPTTNWAFATLPLEKSLETFMQQLMALDRRAAIQVATVFARTAFTYIYDHHREEVRSIGFALLTSDACRDGEPIEKQLQNVERWLIEPTQSNKEIVQQGIDPSRQLEIWEDDLLPPDDQMWLWIIENTHLLSLAIVAQDSEIHDHDSEKSPYYWSAKACLSRSTLCSLKTVAKEPRNLKEDLTQLFNKLNEVW